jgi:hypothetical protein
MIYFARFPTGAIKIGHTDDLDTRLCGLRCEYQAEPEILHTMEGNRETEETLHEMFAHLRFGKTEQFKPGGDLMNFIGKSLLVEMNPEAVEAMPKATEKRGSRRGGRRKGPALTRSMIETEHVRKAKLIAQARGLTLAEYLTRIVAEAVARDFPKVWREMAKDEDPKGTAK